MEAHNDLEFLHSLAIKAGEHKQESEVIVATNEKSPEEVQNDGSDQNVWSSRLRPRDTPDIKQRAGRCGSASGSKAGPADLKKLTVSLKNSLSKKEITEDFLLMTGKKPSQKPKKRTKAEKKRIPGLEMGSTLTDVCVDNYETKAVKTCKKKEYY